MSPSRYTSLLIVSMILTGPASAQEKENPIAKEVKANLKDLSKPFTMLVFVKIKDGW